jgi:hypothetical protein
MGRPLELITRSLLTSVRACDLQRGQVFSLFDGEVRPVQERKQHSKSLASFFLTCSKWDHLCIKGHLSFNGLCGSNGLSSRRGLLIGAWGCVLPRFIPNCLRFSVSDLSSTSWWRLRTPATRLVLALYLRTNHRPHSSPYEVPTPVPAFFLNCMTLEVWSDKLSRNVAMQIKTYDL